MISPDLTYRVALERIDDLRREAKAWRWVKLARAELNPSPSRTEKERHVWPAPPPSQRQESMTNRGTGQASTV
jgi:hypothetical protein